MLYATTRSKTDTYTAYRALTEDRAPDGGFYVPFKLPIFDHAGIGDIIHKSFGESVAFILNQFFSCRLTGWDVDCCIGKSTAKLLPMSRRVVLASLWNNSGNDYEFIEKNLYEKMIGSSTEKAVPTWPRIAIRIAVLFGILGMTTEDETDIYDIAVTAGDFITVVALWFARKIGLPLGSIICACNENSATWDFIHRGELNGTATKISTGMDELDVANPEAIEYLVFSVFGYDETQKLVAKRNDCEIYQVRSDMLSILNSGVFVSVVGSNRTDSLLSSIYRSSGFILDPYSAIAFGGLQDYRAKTGESCPTIILWDKNPLKFYSQIKKATNLGIEEIQNVLTGN